ncbi:MAG: hypothetical protein GX053_01465 [Tissierella sp.]|nr:hypothetical protein [Tissierella sp.]
MRKRILTVIILVIAVSLIACTNASIDNQTVEENQNLVEVNVENKELLIKSEDISDLVVELYGIDDATTIVFNNDAYVAVKMAFDQEFTEDLKDTIIYHIKEKDTQIENVSVTTNAKIFKQIDNVVFNLLQGNSYDSQVKEINKIINNMNKER